MHRYIKGARSERELLTKFHVMGYSVVRSAGSGVNALGPDIIVIKNGVCFAFECKAWDRGSLSLEPDQYEKLVEWEKNSATNTYVAWKIKNKGWYFIRLDEFTKAERNYNVTMKKVFDINRGIDSITSMSLLQEVKMASPVHIIQQPHVPGMGDDEEDVLPASA